MKREVFRLIGQGIKTALQQGAFQAVGNRCQRSQIALLNCRLSLHQQLGDRLLRGGHEHAQLRLRKIGGGFEASKHLGR